MNIIRIIILSLFIFTQSQADTIYNLIKIPNLEIYEINTSNKLRYLYAKQPFTIGVDNNINCFNSEKKVLDEKYELIQKNLNKETSQILSTNYSFIDYLKLQRIRNLTIKDRFNLRNNKNYFERVIHHEVFHIINDSYKEIFNEKVWSNFNVKNFRYAECSTCTDKLGLDTYSDTEGFFTEYSQSTASEDMAEVFSHLMIGSDLSNNDPILDKKIQFIKNNLLKIDENFFL